MIILLQNMKDLHQVFCTDGSRKTALRKVREFTHDNSWKGLIRIKEIYILFNNEEDAWLLARRSRSKAANIFGSLPITILSIHFIFSLPKHCKTPAGISLKRNGSKSDTTPRIITIYILFIYGYHVQVL